jgi:hypothetical protein
VHVLEDGPDVCGSESDAEYSDHGEQWSYADMYTPEVLGLDGKPKTDTARLTTEPANALRATGRSVPQAQSAQEPEQRQPTPVPADDEDLSEEQERTLRRFKKKGTAGGLVTVR